MDTKTIDSKLENISLTDRVRQAFSTVKKYTALVLAGTAIAITPVALQGCIDEETSECCDEMYENGKCDYNMPSGCDEFGQKCVDHYGLCSCEQYQKTCKP